MKLNNTYFLLRHGEAKSNKERFVSSWPEKVNNPLTEKGKKQIKRIIPKLRKENIKLIFSSDLLRCKETAKIVSKELNFKIKFDKRLREIDMGLFNGKSEQKWNEFFKTRKKRFIKKSPEGENYRDVKRRIKSFIKDIDKNYKNKDILIVSHGVCLFILQAIVKGFTEKQEIIDRKELIFKTGELRILLR